MSKRITAGYVRRLDRFIADGRWLVCSGERHGERRAVLLTRGVESALLIGIQELGFFRMTIR